MIRNLLLLLTCCWLAGCSTVRLADALEQEVIPAEDAVIPTDDDEQYSTAMQLFYLGTQKEPNRHNNLDTLSKDYYRDMADHNNLIALTSFMMYMKGLSNLDIASFFFATSKYDQLFGHYKSNVVLFIEPFSESETIETAYTRVQAKLTDAIRKAYPGNEHKIFEYEDSVFGDITKFTAIWDNHTPACQAYLDSETFNLDYLEAPDHLRSCYLRRHGFIYEPEIIEGQLPIPGVPAADRYFVVSYAYYDQALEAQLKQSRYANTYVYEPAYEWTGGDMHFKSEAEKARFEAQVKQGSISPYPYLLRLADQQVLLFQVGNDAS
ncbi:hypothetical protein [Photobacterium atrarenae]|uniref:Lipoprotein n=1 Tax=Photobacterium atrarenae TaxID=865757 RepID=A0ABY5GKA9_9GAMM|nr:hypothetical protein [Photobacterium atrarenae]UTV29672.1 hypothetical protein NNL38_21930 [Photobacterium atrarenae]